MFLIVMKTMELIFEIKRLFLVLLLFGLKLPSSKIDLTHSQVKSLPWTSSIILTKSIARFQDEPEQGCKELTFAHAANLSPQHIDIAQGKKQLSAGIARKRLPERGCQKKIEDDV